MLKWLKATHFPFLHLQILDIRHGQNIYMAKWSQKKRFLELRRNFLIWASPWPKMNVLPCVCNDFIVFEKSVWFKDLPLIEYIVSVPQSFSVVRSLKYAIVKWRKFISHSDEHFKMFYSILEFCRCNKDEKSPSCYFVIHSDILLRGITYLSVVVLSVV